MKTHKLLILSLSFILLLGVFGLINHVYALTRKDITTTKTTPLTTSNLISSTITTETKVPNKPLIYFGDRDNNVIYLTFDDGFSTINTEKILDTLKEKEIQITFFIEGEFMNDNPILVRRMIDEGHFVGNHTMSHKDIRKMTNDEFRNDLTAFENLFTEITGTTNAKFFRPPMGFINDEKRNILTEFGYTVILWDVAYYDYDIYNDRGIEYAYQQIMKQTIGGSIILMHTMTRSNVEVLPLIIDKLMDQGYTFGCLSELIE